MGEWMDREADVDHMPPSMLNTLSPGQSSPRLEASPLLFAAPPFASSPITPRPSRIPRRNPRPLTFYHHNRYIIPRSVFYSRVTSWNAFVRDIVRLSFSPVLFFPPIILFVFFSTGYLIGEIAFFFFFRRDVFSEMRLWYRGCRILSRVVELGYVRGDNNEVLYRLTLLTYGSRKVHQFSGKLNK